MKQVFEIELKLNEKGSKFTLSEIEECIKDALFNSFDFEKGEEVKIKELEV